MQDPRTPNLIIHCIEHGVTLLKVRCSFYMHEIFSTCAIQNFEVSHVVMHVNQYAILKSTTVAEKIVYLQDLISIRVMTLKSSTHRFTRLMNITTNSVFSRHDFTVIKRRKYFVIQQIFSACAHLNEIMMFANILCNLKYSDCKYFTQLEV